MKLSPLQQRVALLYDKGEFSHVTGTDELDDLGDTLFKFAMLEASDAEPFPDALCNFLATAIHQLQSLQSDLMGGGPNITKELTK